MGKSPELENIFLKYNLQWKSDVFVGGSLIDYSFKHNDKRRLLLVRNTVNEESLNYFYSVGDKWDKRILLTEFDVSEKLFRIAKDLDIRIMKPKDYFYEIANIGKKGSLPTDTMPQTVDNISRLAPGARLLILISAGWKELILIFILGFITAILGKDYFWPWIKELLRRVSIF